jgi:hypothetical protein
MYTDIGKLLEEMRGIQEQYEQFFDEARAKFRCSLDDGRIRFSREVQQLHRHYRVSSLHYPGFFACADAASCQQGLAGKCSALENEAFRHRDRAGTGI